MSNDEIIDHQHLTFDPGDPLNGSLYICVPLGTDARAVNVCITTFKQAGLWSDAEQKQVADEHRDAYKVQLRFIESVTYLVDGVSVTLARFDHEKFPSDDDRWAGWKSTLDAHYARV